MINLTSISIRNFLSYGNAPTPLKLNEYKNTLIASSSGSGKSVWVDSVCYALFGKPYRNIKLPQLVNSINQKGMLTTIEFNIGSIEYKVIRGMKPGIFEIYQDGKLLDQEAATRDYQAYLENVILKINYKTFCQVVLIGTAGFTPFMQLPAGQRRDVIEDVLDIAIFSEMNVLLKARILECRATLLDVTTKLDAAKVDTQNQIKIIKLMEEHHQDKVTSLESQRDTINATTAKLEWVISDYKDKIVELNDRKREAVPDYSREIFLLEDSNDRLAKSLIAIGNLESCPTCLQCVTDDHKKITKKLTAEKIANGLEKLLKLRLKQDVYSSVTSHNAALDDDIKSHTMENDHTKLEIKKSKLESITITESINVLEQDTSGLEDEKIKLKNAAEVALGFIARKKELLTEKSIQEVVAGLLKDTGIKSAIIREYTPILNRLINKYLAEFGFFINFTLDEGFNESILSRGRDDFSYNSFSEGEKTKIDLSILFAFRQITELKNSASVNLLFLDEVGDQHLDLNAKESFVNILSQLDGGNIFVISHNSPATDMYDQVIHVIKKNDFSVMEIQ